MSVLKSPGFDAIFVLLLISEELSHSVQSMSYNDLKAAVLAGVVSGLIVESIVQIAKMIVLVLL